MTKNDIMGRLHTLVGGNRPIGYIPTVTGRHVCNHGIALCSASASRGCVTGTELTIIDCHTFYLRKARDVDRATSHYLWLCEFAEQWGSQEDLVFVAPDFDWLGPEVSSALASKWPTTLHTLVVPGSLLFDRVEAPIGWAVTPRHRPAEVPAHIQWVHHFSQTFEPYAGREGLVQTYDSVCLRKEDR